jgi:hypothetical protein
MLERKLQSVGVPVEFRYKNDGKTGNANVQQYLLHRFSQPAPARS